MHIDELVLEITRRCNARCKHCMRGEADIDDMSTQTIKRIFEEVTSIGVITFTGGEPTEAVDRIDMILSQAKQYGVQVQNFYCLTNGREASMSLAMALLKWYDYCSDTSKSELRISRDKFHVEVVKDMTQAFDMYAGLSFFQGITSGEIEMPYNEGRALKNGIGIKEAYLDPRIVVVDEAGKITQVEGSLYINVNGDVIPSCTMSYKSQEKFKLGNVRADLLNDILAKSMVGV